MSVVQELKDDLRMALKDAIVKSDKLELTEIPDIELEEPREEEHGDYATNIAMVLAGQAKMAPRKIAEIIVGDLELDEYFHP